MEMNEKEKKVSFVKPSSLEISENARWRVNSNLDEMMESIKQHGILQPITARAEDKKVICGNRRLASAVKLGWENVPVIFVSGIDDKQLLILNLMENMQRKDISSMEIGRQCDIMLKNTKFKMTISELSSTLGVKSSRIKACLDAFKYLPEKWRDKVVHLDSASERKFGDLPENIVLAVLNFNRFHKKLSNQEQDVLFKEAADNKLSISLINLIGLLVDSGMPLKRALKEVKYYTIGRLNFIILKTELASVIKKEGVSGKQELFSKIIKKSYPNLLY